MGIWHLRAMLMMGKGYGLRCSSSTGTLKPRARDVIWMLCVIDPQKQYLVDLYTADGKEKLMREIFTCLVCMAYGNTRSWSNGGILSNHSWRRIFFLPLAWHRIGKFDMFRSLVLSYYSR